MLFFVLHIMSRTLQIPQGFAKSRDRTRFPVSLHFTARMSSDSPMGHQKQRLPPVPRSYTDIENGAHMCGTLTAILLLIDQPDPVSVLTELKEKFEQKLPCRLLVLLGADLCAAVLLDLHLACAPKTLNDETIYFANRLH